MTFSLLVVKVIGSGSRIPATSCGKSTNEDNESFSSFNALICRCSCTWTRLDVVVAVAVAVDIVVVEWCDTGTCTCTSREGWAQASTPSARPPTPTPTSSILAPSNEKPRKSEEALL